MRIAIQAAAWIARAGVSANSVSMIGMFSGIAAGACMAATPVTGHWERVLWLAAAAGIQFRLLCNMLDGMVAINTNSSSRMGELFNEFPDRVSDLAGFIGLGYAVQGHVPLGYLSGALAVLVAYARILAASAGAPQDYRGPMAKQQRMFIATLACLAMGILPMSARPVFTQGGAGLPAAALALISAGCVITISRRLVRAGRVLKSDIPPKH